MKILVSGANGQVGSELRDFSLNTATDDWLFKDLPELDICDVQSMRKIFEEFNPDFFFNCGAYTAVDQAEKEIETATRVNADCLVEISKLCNEHNCVLMHLSSDYVYHHNPARPLKESDQHSPKGIYAKTKLEGDLNVIKYASAYIILRTSWVYSSYGNNFVKTMIRLANDQGELSIVSDQIGTPTYAGDIANALYQMSVKIACAENKNAYNGVYNFSNDGVTNWAEFAECIFRKKDLKVKVKPISTEAFNAPAPRPNWSLMNKDKIVKTFGIELQDWEKSLDKCLEKLAE